MADFLGETLQREKRDCLEEKETKDICLPDKDRWLRPIEELCLNDCDWVEEPDTIYFLHPRFSEYLAKLFRVRTAREHDEDEFSESFGQHEDLTTRINRLLEGYTRDASIFKELLQNADDAGATEVRFIKDFRRHNTEQLLQDQWKDLFGPALCVFNDACFTPRDMQGIQALGEGSKEGDALKTGKYGVGFNAVYNLTDTPCFWTRVLPEEGDSSKNMNKDSTGGVSSIMDICLQGNDTVNGKELGEKLCVMDPNFFVTGHRRSRLCRPGTRLSVTDRFRAQYPNMLSPFLLEAESTQVQKGTVFRLPLRTKEKAEESNIRQPAVTIKEVISLLQEFKSDMGESLLFLNNVKKIGVYKAKFNGTIELEYETQLTVVQTKRQQEFFEHVKQESKKLKTEGSAPGLCDFTPKEVVLQCCLSASDGDRKDWLIVNKFGFSHTDNLPEKLQHPRLVQNHRLLPLSGVALCLSPDKKQIHPKTATMYKRRRSSFYGKEIPSRKMDMTRAVTSRERTTASVNTESEEEFDDSSDERSQKEFQAYCMLPLPVNTGLPVHVNGRFSLDHETRRNIDTRPGSELKVWNEQLVERVIVPAYITALKEVRKRCFSEEEVSLKRGYSQDEEGRSQREHNSRKRSGYSKGKGSFEFKRQCNEVMSLMTGRDLTWKLKQYNNFFPDHRSNADAFWRFLTKSFYQQLAQTEADVFPAIRKDLDQLVWVPAVKSSGFPGYFCRQLPAGVKEVLMKLNMNIIQSSFRIFSAFVNSEVHSVKNVNENTVVDFLHSCHADESETDSCNLKHLPKPVWNTTFGSEENVMKLFNFIHEKVEDLKDLPLCLRMSKTLHCFTADERTLFSPFCDLLPESDRLFLDTNLIRFLPSDAEKYVKELDIRTFVELLPKTLDQLRFGSGSCTVLEVTSSDQTFPNRKWIKRFWVFLDKQLLQQALDMDAPTESACLNQWSLIPAVTGTAVSLFPFKDKHHVVYIPEPDLHNASEAETDNKEEPLNKSLEKLLLNKLDIQLSGKSARQMVASFENPKGLLTALCHGNLQDHDLNSSEAGNILDFFYRRLTFDRNSSVAGDIRRVPFFEKLDGTFIAVGNENTLLCLPDGIHGVPMDGLEEWSEDRRISIVKKNSRLKELYEELGMKFPKKSEFYELHVLPHVACLPTEAIPRHIDYIRKCLWGTSDHDSLKRVLCKTRFIKGPDGTLWLASDFFSPDCKVFKIMMSLDRFPPSPYNTEKWKSFLVGIGLVCEVSEDLFLRFAQQVEEAGRNSVSEKTKQQSQELARCLKDSEQLRQETFLKQLRDVKFLTPLSKNQLEFGGLLQSIHPMFQPLTHLVSLSEGYSSDKQFLLWTSRCLLSDDADPTKFDFWEPEKNELIGFQAKPSNDSVVEHVTNVCQSLSRERTGDTTMLSNFNVETLTVVTQIFETIYAYLMTLSEMEHGSLREHAIIFDINKKAMFLPDQVVIKIVPEQVVEGYVMDAPEKLGKFFDLFRKLGVSEHVSVDHYAKALERIHAASFGNILNPNDLKLVRDAVHNLFKLLKSNSEENYLITPALYLPAVDISMLTMTGNEILEVRLMDSRHLISEVNPKQQKRMKTSFKDVPVFIGFDQLKLEEYNVQREARLLPKLYRMKCWHDVVKEGLVESCKDQAREDPDTRLVTNLLRSGNFASIVKRLVNHQRSVERRAFTDNDAKKIEANLGKLTVFKVTNLQTLLIKDGHELIDTTERKYFFRVKEKTDDENEHHDTKVSLYVDSDQVISINFNQNRKFRSHVHKAVLWAVGTNSIPLLVECLEDLPSAADLMDDEDISPFEKQQMGRIAIPEAGSFVPENMHCLLDNDVYEFKPGEYVAYELYDPFLNIHNMDVGTSDEMSEESSETTEQAAGQGSTKKPIYIFAEVIDVIAPEDAVESDVRTRLMLLRYRINVGGEASKEVEACELYKFIRANPNIIVPFTGNAALPPSNFSQYEHEDDLKKVLKDIRRQLREIWHNLRDDISRKRAVKRLLLKWHPDKNTNKDFCTKVFQQIRWYITLLENGKKLSSDDEDTVDSGPFSTANRRRWRRGKTSSRGRGAFCEDFFDNVFWRGQSYAESRKNDQDGAGGSTSTSGGSDFFTSRANPQPEEGRRWMRQARKDLEAARFTFTHRGVGIYNWACYQAHQTAEKALKAVLYRKDARHGMKSSHDICSIANCMRDTQIADLVRKLDDVVRYHTRMRYPDFLEFPRIPSDVYDENEAREACDLAEQIVDRAQHLFDTFTTPPPSPPRQRTPPPPAPRPGPSYRAIASSSGSNSRSLSAVSSSAVRRPAIDRSDGPSTKAPRLDSEMKALPPPP